MDFDAARAHIFVFASSSLSPLKCLYIYCQMSDNEDWMADDKEEEKPAPETAVPSSGRAQRGRGSEEPEEEPNKNDESDWVTERKEEKAEEPSRRGRNRQEEDSKPKVEENISEIIHDPRR